jgi:hypothetical protein
VGALSAYPQGVVADEHDRPVTRGSDMLDGRGGSAKRFKEYTR